MTTPSANPCLQLMYLQCSKSVVQAVVAGFSLHNIFFSSHIAVYYIFPHTHAHAHAFIHIMHTQTKHSPPHSSPYPRDIWASGRPDGGCRLGAGMWACLCGNKRHQGRVETEQKVLCVLVYSCVSRFIPFLKWNCVDFLLLCSYFMFFICCLQVSSTHSFVQRFAVEMLSAVLGSARLASCLALIRAGGWLWGEG